ncbi:MAG: hypothetical protein ACJASB_003147 [Shewanella psychromarinicola]|jgi:hypothetical protein
MDATQANVCILNKDKQPLVILKLYSIHNCSCNTTTLHEEFLFCVYANAYGINISNLIDITSPFASFLQ